MGHVLKTQILKVLRTGGMVSHKYCLEKHIKMREYIYIYNFDMKIMNLTKIKNFLW